VLCSCTCTDAHRRDRGLQRARAADREGDHPACTTPTLSLGGGRSGKPGLTAQLHPCATRGAAPLSPHRKRNRRAVRAKPKYAGCKEAASQRPERADERSGGAQRRAQRRARRSVSIAPPKAGRGTERGRPMLSTRLFAKGIVTARPRQRISAGSVRLHEAE